jgi:type II secretory pathway pseudopilin PulG
VTRRSGFSLIEILVALVVFFATLAGLLALFAFVRRSSRAQSTTAELQQSLRVAQHEIVHAVRMAGRGGLPRGELPAGIALALRNNVSAENPWLVPATATGPRAMPGSDILTVRGVLSTPLFLVETTADAFHVVGDPPTGGSVRVQDHSPTGISQDLAPLREAAERHRPEALLLVSPVDARLYAVVELVGGYDSPAGKLGAGITLTFRTSGGTHADRYRALSPGGSFPVELTSVWQVGLLEEYRYYVRQEDAPPEKEASDAFLSPRSCLARARFYPATDSTHGGSAANLTVAIADRITDLQIALGLDQNDDGEITESSPPGGSDEWLFNSSEDPEASDPRWNRLDSSRAPRLLYVRVSTVGHGARAEPEYRAPALPAIEDRAGEVEEPADERALQARGYRRWLLTALVEPRNLS